MEMRYQLRHSPVFIYPFFANLEYNTTECLNTQTRCVAHANKRQIFVGIPPFLRDTPSIDKGGDAGTVALEKSQRVPLSPALNSKQELRMSAFALPFVRIGDGRAMVVIHQPPAQIALGGIHRNQPHPVRIAHG